jgi:hypothetical protein
MKILKIKNLRQMPDQDSVIAHCVETVDGLEYAHINMDTGEISYSSEACINEQHLRDTFAKQGVELEDAHC